jgi:hypothetical protein
MWELALPVAARGGPAAAFLEVEPTNEVEQGKRKGLGRHPSPLLQALQHCCHSRSYRLNPGKRRR